ncbi:Disintegrin and metalloproteinase domain-containing protein 10 [Acipenser ruthenus]|uniref:Disintegrin and metalloproteinase domain-containing protein 10 n=1 Tax=Acipenser ruthenus TaxID=7906 RepID=A0A444V1G5_ACIRT|nr:Disintegrin and metalloproteinase domain-containing protein 10 [Acipenser ruthenus]
MFQSGARLQNKGWQNLSQSSVYTGRINYLYHLPERHFNLRMKRDTSLFTDDFKIEISGEETNYDTSHIYTGEIFGEKGSMSHGSVVDGRFEGFIQTHQGTFYVEPSERYLKDRSVPFHSVIYHEDDIKYPHKYGAQGGCADHSVFDRMKKYQSSGTLEENPEETVVEEPADGPVLLRKRRTTQPPKNTCQLFIQTDHLFFKYYGTREAVIAQISSHIKAIDSIYQSTDFLGVRNISFMVKRIRINTTQDERDPSNPFRFANIGVEKFLELNSEQNHDDYCLAYVFTDRDFDDGVLGLAWVGAPAGSSGGICEKSKLYSDGKKKSLNTGIITVQNYASHVPPKVSHITFAHEVGHNFGSPHDSGTECTPGESKSQSLKEKGNYIMYARATSGDKLNNNKFSICSVRNISQVLEKKRGSCFVGKFPNKEQQNRSKAGQNPQRTVCSRFIWWCREGGACFSIELFFLDAGKVGQEFNPTLNCFQLDLKLDVVAPFSVCF